MPNVLTDPEDIREAMEFLAGCRIRLCGGGGSSIECTVLKVKVFGSARDGYSGFLLVADSLGELPIRMPSLIKETSTSYFLDYSTTFLAKSSAEIRIEIEQQDQSFYDFLGDRAEYVPPIEIRILDTE